MNEPLWVKMPIIRNKILSAAKNENDLNFILNRAGITKEDLDNPEFKLTLEQDITIVNAALKISNDPFLGLHIGEKTTQAVLGITGYLMDSSKDVLTALKNLQQYTVLFTQLYNFSIEVSGDIALFYCEPIKAWNEISPETAIQSVDNSFAGAMHIIKLLTGKFMHPVKIKYRYKKPFDTSEHKRILRCEPLFEQDSNCMVFSLMDMNLPVIGYNKELNTYFNRLLEDEMLREQQRTSFIPLVKKVILQNYNFRFPGLEEAAKLMNITPRTLQRKLNEERSSFRLLSDSIKKEIACSLLSNNSLTVSEIAYKLGYTEAGAFHRAFRQWTGKTPRLYRNS